MIVKITSAMCKMFDYHIMNNCPLYNAIIVQLPKFDIWCVGNRFLSTVKGGVYTWDSSIWNYQVYLKMKESDSEIVEFELIR